MINLNLKNIAPSYIREILSVATHNDMISFAGGLPDPNSFPLELMKESFQELSQLPEFFQYNSTRGLEGLIESIGKRFDIKKDRSLIITNGSQQGLDLIARAFIAPGDQVLVEAPSYLGALQVFKLAGAQLKTIPILDNGPDLDALKNCFERQKIKFFYVIPDYQNPTGYCYPLVLRKAIAQLCRQYGVMIIEDSPYRELGFKGEKLALISDFFPEGSIVLHSFSKIVSPGLRIGCVESTSKIVNSLIKLKQISDLHSNIPSQFILQKLIEHRGFELHIQQVRQNYYDKYRLLVGELEKELANEISFKPVQGGMFIWLSFRDPEINTMEFAKKALTKKLAVVPGSVFYLNGSNNQNSLRLNFSHPTLANIKKGVHHFAQTVRIYSKVN